MALICCCIRSASRDLQTGFENISSGCICIGLGLEKCSVNLLALQFRTSVTFPASSAGFWVGSGRVAGLLQKSIWKGVRGLLGVAVRCAGRLRDISSILRSHASGVQRRASAIALKVEPMSIFILVVSGVQSEIRAFEVGC